MFKPKARFNRVTNINTEYLLKHEIKGVILDVDNTLIDWDENPVEGVEDWVKSLKENGIKLCIASNSSKTGKVSRIASKLDIPYFYLSFKPLLRGLKKAKKELNLDSKHIAEVGDQLFTDVVGANRMKMFSILTTPLVGEKHFVSKIKRKIESLFTKNIEFTKE